MADRGFNVEVKGREEFVPVDELPFEALDINDSVREEDLESVRTG